MTKRRNRPTDLGREAGKHLARFCDIEEAKRMTLRARCGTCAFRAGTVPNGCEPTVLDALKCAIENTTFLCHEFKGQEVPCAGWLMMRSTGKTKCPWPFTDEMGKGEPSAAQSEQRKEKS